MIKMNKLANREGKTIRTINRSRLAKRLILMAVVMASVAVFSAVGANAMTFNAVMMDFTSDAKKKLKLVIEMVGGGLGIWGVVNLLEGYGSDNPGAKSQGMKQLMAGAALILSATLVDSITWTAGN